MVPESDDLRGEAAHHPSSGLHPGGAGEKIREGEGISRPSKTDVRRAGHRERRYIKDLLDELEKENPRIRDNIWKAMAHVKTDYLPAKLGGDELKAYSYIRSSHAVDGRSGGTEGQEENVAKKETAEKPICQNKRARINYFIDETYEAGIALVGTEVKALRDGRANLKDSYALIRDEELFLYDLHISPYSHGNRANHDPLRIRKLLMHKQEIRRLYGKSQERGLALIPLRMYFRNGKVKVEIGVGRGKKLYDKREDIKLKEDRREMERGLRAKNRDA